MSGSANPGITANLPQAGGPIVTQGGIPTSYFLAFLLALYNRTGGTTGISLAEVEQIAAQAQEDANAAQESAEAAEAAATSAEAAAAAATTAANAVSLQVIFAL